MTVILIIGLWALIVVGFLILLKQGKHDELARDDADYFRRRCRRLEQELALTQAKLVQANALVDAAIEAAEGKEAA